MGFILYENDLILVMPTGQKIIVLFIVVQALGKMKILMTHKVLVWRLV